MRTVLITGANRGIGLEFVRQLLARGDRVIATCRKPGHATELNKLAFAHPGRLSLLQLDVAKANAAAALAHEARLITDAIDTLINNAGVLVEGERWGAIEVKSLDSSFATNVSGPLLLTQALGPLLIKGSQPVVMNVSSVLGSIGERDTFNTPSYCISKAALNMATRLIAHAMRESGVIAFCIHPGWVQTQMGGAKAQISTEDSVRGMLVQLDAIDMQRSGHFLAWDGRAPAW